MAHQHNLGLSTQNPGFKVGIKAGHNCNDNDQRHHSDHYAGNGKNRYQRNKSLFLFRSQIAAADKKFKRHQSHPVISKS